MDWGNFLFSFQGRINRAKYWAFVVGSMVAAFVAIGAVFASGFSLPLILLLVVAYLLLFYIGLAVGAKRLHDRGRSAWWLLVFYLVPGVLQVIGDLMHVDAAKLVLSLVTIGIAIWAFVELGCLRGTDGPNQYGPDPLGGPFGGSPVTQPTR